MSARRHLEWRWFLTTALGLSMLTLAALTQAAHVDERTNGNVYETARGGVVLPNSWSLVGMGASARQGAIYVDANAPSDPSPGDPNIGDPDEDGTASHPFDSVFEAMAVALDGDTILVAPGHYAPVDALNNRLEFAGRNIQLKSWFEEDYTQIDRTVLDATIVFAGTEGPDCEMVGFKIQGPAFDGISGNGTRATLRHCIIQGNSTCDGSVLTDFAGLMANCLIADNASAFDCGSRPAVANFGGTMANCTIVNNATGISVHTADMVNCIFYHNGFQTIQVQDHGSLSVAYSSIQGGENAILASDTETVEWTSSTALNPRFVKLGLWEGGQLREGDYHLKSQGLRWSPEMVSDSHWVRDGVTSPCIDGGDPSMDTGAEALGFPFDMGVLSRVNWRINMGCYGGTAQASLPFVGQVPGLITATASSSYEEDSGPEKTSDGSGINARDEHSIDNTAMWLSDDSDATPWIQYEFDRIYVLYEMWGWNYNVPFESLLGYGAKDVTIEYSENGVDWAVLGDLQFAQATGKPDYAADTILRLDGISARYVRLTIRSSWGMIGLTGLSEIRFFADRTPGPVEIQDPRAASNPGPADGSTDVLLPMRLSWTPGDQAVTHNVYLGTDLDEVDTAQAASPSGGFLVLAHDANSLYLAEPLEQGRTYYWRVDETAAAPSTPTRGSVWSFTVAPYAYRVQNIVATSNAIPEEGAGPENTVNGSGLNANGEHSTKNTDMWLGELGDDPVYIQFQFDAVYELHEMRVWNYNVMFEAILGFGVKEATIEYSENGTDWTLLGDVVMAQATASKTYVSNTIVAFDGVSAKYVRLTVNSGHSVLEKFGLSEVRFSTNRAPLSAAESYTLLLDGFETYNDDNLRIYQLWIDGYGMADNGSVVGHLEAPFAETTIVNSGNQSMPLFYDNGGASRCSEARRELDAELRDWRVGDAEALTLYFHGNTNNDSGTGADRLYVAVEDNQGRIAVVHHPASGALLIDDWQEWTIGLDEFGDVDLSYVRRLTLGVGDRDNPQPGGSGVVYIDDIGLSAGAVRGYVGN